MSLPVKLKKLRPDARIPAYQSTSAAACDLCAALDAPLTLEPGDRVAQMAFVPVLRASFEEADEIGETERGEGGFGHTGV